MIGFEEARSRVLLLGTPSLLSEVVDLDDADGRVLAEDVCIKADLPPFDYAAMDGYAVEPGDFDAGLPLQLPVRGEVRAGSVPGPLAAGSTMRIFTGAPMPEGARAVVMQEHVTREGDVATFMQAPKPGENVRRRGADLAAGAVAIEKGTRLRPAHLALAAAADCAKLVVYRQPKVAVIATGDELRRPGTEAVYGTIAESNTVMLRAMAVRAGAVARVLPCVRDDHFALVQAFDEAFNEADVVFTVGGVSVGDHDLVRSALVAVGVSLDFWRVAIKPGKPIAVGQLMRPGRRNAIAMGLPGNPAAAMVTFTLFGIPLLRTLQGDARALPHVVRARMTHAYARKAHANRTEFARALLIPSREGLFVTIFGNQASGAMTTMAEANALVCVPNQTTDIRVGDEVDVLPSLSDFSDFFL
ncbi:MAG: molybdopterin molybdotransferase MoeA [Polyangiaceae bacterium]|nr:molybdopterin molybdotransferase MoeA [Polyangiaceae bacterium]